jgi:cytochrome c peroxidase
VWWCDRALVVALALLASAAGAADRDDNDRAAILALSPLPAPARDSTNRFSGNPAAIALGRALFFDPRLSRSGHMACATCHDPAAEWSGDAARLPRDDGRLQPRHAPSLRNAGHARWFFWDGRRDTLWAQALEAIGSDMGGGPERLAGDARLTALAADTQARFVVAGKALAAFVETLDSAPTTFDRYVADLRAGRGGALPPRAAAGLRVFLHQGQCVACHGGPLFTDGEFHATRLPPLPGEVAEDSGRYVGLYLLGAATYSAGGRFSDDPHGGRARLSAMQVRSRSAWGAFKTPSLRGVARRRYFMHDGRFSTLAAVIEHYSETPGATSLLPADVPAAPLHLTEEQKRDLAAFLALL